MIPTLGLIIDVVIIGVLLIFGFVGLKKGFFKSVISLLSIAVCLAVAVFTAKFVANWINGIYNFSALISGKVSSGLNGTNEFFALPIATYASKDALIAAIPANINKLLAQVVKVVFNNSNIDYATAEGTIGEVVGSSIGQIAMIIIAGILIFVVLRLAIMLLSKAFDNLAKIKMIGWLNKVLGFLFGAIKAGCVIIILNCVLIGLSLIPAVNKTITPIIQDNTHVEKVVYNTTDKFVGKYIIEGNLLQNWLENQWNSR